MRSVWKLPYVHRSLLRLTKRFNNGVNIFQKVLNIFCRGSLIPLLFLDRKIKIYNGTWFLTNVIVPFAIGLRFGELSFTKRMGRNIHAPDVEKGNKKKLNQRK